MKLLLERSTNLSFKNLNNQLVNSLYFFYFYITSRISAPLDISQWQVLVKTEVKSEGIAYTDLIPNFTSSSGKN